MSIIAQAPPPQTVLSFDGVALATYDAGPADAPVVLAVHGFASSASANWYATGWVRELLRSGYRVLALDQRGHGRSGKPHDPAAYSMAALVADVRAVIDTYLVDDAAYVGYSLSARVGWHTAVESPHVIRRAVLGGIPDTRGGPMARFRIDEARALLEHGTPVQDRVTETFLAMARSIPGNDLEALVALVEGMRDGPQPDPASPPTQPVLLATGSEDRIVAASRGLAAAAPHGEFFEIPGRNHFNAPTARSFRDRAIDFLGRSAGAEG